MRGSIFGGVTDGGVNKAVILRFLCFRAAAVFSFFAFCSSVRTLALRFTFGFGFDFAFDFALALVFGLGFAAFLVAAGFFVALVLAAGEVALLIVVAGFLFDAVARPVCAFGRPGRAAGTAVAYFWLRPERDCITTTLGWDDEVGRPAFWSCLTRSEEKSAVADGARGNSLRASARDGSKAIVIAWAQRNVARRVEG